jgi:hypothetical protein
MVLPSLLLLLQFFEKAFLLSGTGCSIAYQGIHGGIDELSDLGGKS